MQSRKKVFVRAYWKSVVKLFTKISHRHEAVVKHSRTARRHQKLCNQCQSRLFFSLSWQTSVWLEPSRSPPKHTRMRWWRCGTGRLMCFSAPPSTPPPSTCGASVASSMRLLLVGRSFQDQQWRMSSTSYLRWGTEISYFFKIVEMYTGNSAYIVLKVHIA